MNACLYQPNDVRDGLLRLGKQAAEALMMGPYGRRIPGAIETAERGGRMVFSPDDPEMSPPPGVTVSVDVQGRGGTWAFYTDTFGSDTAGRWLLDRPSVLRRQRDASGLAWMSAPEREGLRLNVPNSKSCPVVELYPDGLVFRCQQLAPWARVGEPLLAHLEVSEVRVFPVRVDIRDLRLDPTGMHTRLVGARITCLEAKGRLWWETLMADFRAR